MKVTYCVTTETECDSLESFLASWVGDKRPMSILQIDDMCYQFPPKRNVFCAACGKLMAQYSAPHPLFIRYPRLAGKKGIAWSDLSYCTTGTRKKSPCQIRLEQMEEELKAQEERSKR